MQLEVGRGFGAWLGLISLLALWVIWAFDGSVARIQPGGGSLVFPIVVSILGAAAMAFGGFVGVRVTWMIRPVGVRVAALTVIVPGVAFVAASLPFILLYVYGPIIAWVVSVAGWGVYAYLITLLWTVCRLRRAPGDDARASLGGRDWRVVITALLGLWGLYTLYVAVAAKTGLPVF